MSKELDKYGKSSCSPAKIFPNFDDTASLCLGGLFPPVGTPSSSPLKSLRNLMRRNRRSWFSLGSGAVPTVAGGGVVAAGGAAMVVPGVLDLRTALMSEDAAPSLQIR